MAGQKLRHSVSCCQPRSQWEWLSRQLCHWKPASRHDWDMICATSWTRSLQVVLVTSVGTDSPFFPLNLLWGVLFWKKRAEEALQRSGLDYTIIRPGGTHRSAAPLIGLP